MVSLARGGGTPESDLDIAVLVQPDAPPDAVAALDRRWREHYQIHQAFSQAALADGHTVTAAIARRHVLRMRQGQSARW